MKKNNCLNFENICKIRFYKQSDQKFRQLKKINIAFHIKYSCLLLLASSFLISGSSSSSGYGRVVSSLRQIGQEISQVSGRQAQQNKIHSKIGSGIHQINFRVLLHYSKGQLSKRTFVRGTNVQGDFALRKPQSKETCSNYCQAQLQFQLHLS